MHAVVGHSEIDASRGDEAAAILANGILPGIKEATGFVSATFVRSADGSTGRSMAVFEDEESARAVAEGGPGLMPADSPIRIVSLDVYEVVARG